MWVDPVLKLQLLTKRRYRAPLHCNYRALTGLARFCFISKLLRAAGNDRQGITCMCPAVTATLLISSHSYSGCEIPFLLAWVLQVLAEVYTLQNVPNNCMSSQQQNSSTSVPLCSNFPALDLISDSVCSSLLACFESTHSVIQNFNSGALNITNFKAIHQWSIKYNEFSSHTYVFHMHMPQYRLCRCCDFAQGKKKTFAYNAMLLKRIKEFGL